MAQHYAILRPSTDDDDGLHFWISNSSLLGGTTEGAKLITYSESWISLLAHTESPDYKR